MPRYRIYTVGREGHLSAAEDIECLDDQDAIRKAQRAANGQAGEVWKQGRLIMRFAGVDQ